MTRKYDGILVRESVRLAPQNTSEVKPL
ncbi:hypothetical protein EYZ11_008707 [Aspergillus tanneri]|uniref:Uncharacterized protein n=1 Tax=Aspergillus tanneri TaxID=1220188 RepID=A0A4S3JBZ0_9EURO|nr:hypothetical protein EYZ11_008707 [Aspergillus tanneri]